MCGLSLNKLIYPSLKDALYQVWLKLARWFWRRRFLNFVNAWIFTFSKLSPLEKSRAFHLNKLKFHSPLKDDLLKSSMCIHYFVITCPQKNQEPFIYRTSILFTKGWFVPSLIEICTVFLQKKIFKSNVFSQFPISYSFISPTPKDALCQVWLKLTQWFWGKRWKCEKFTTTTTTPLTTLALCVEASFLPQVQNTFLKVKLYVKNLSPIVNDLPWIRPHCWAGRSAFQVEPPTGCLRSSRILRTPLEPRRRSGVPLSSIRGYSSHPLSMTRRDGINIPQFTATTWQSYWLAYYKQYSRSHYILLDIVMYNVLTQI